jgi:hypothetical protein
MKKEFDLKTARKVRDLWCFPYRGIRKKELIQRLEKADNKRININGKEELECFHGD